MALRCGVLAVAYLGAARLGLALSFTHEHVTAVWPPTGLAVAALRPLRTPPLAGRLRRRAASRTSWTASPSPSRPRSPSATRSRRSPRPSSCDGRTSGRRFDRLRDVLWLTFGAGLGAMTISATIGAAALTLIGAEPFWPIWRVWWVGDAMGVVLVAPLLLTLLSEPVRRVAARPRVAAEHRAADAPSQP